MEPFELVGKVNSRDTFFEFPQVLEFDKHKEDKKREIKPFFSLFQWS